MSSTQRRSHTAVIQRLLETPQQFSFSVPSGCWIIGWATQPPAGRG